MSEQWALRNLILVIIIPAIVSYLTGNTFVNHANKKRRHSEKIKNSIDVFLNNYESYFQINVRINNGGHFVGDYTNEINELLYSRFLLQHIDSAYPKVSRKWHNHETAWKKRVNKKAEFLEDLRLKFHTLGEGLGVKPLYVYERIYRPDSFLFPEKIAYSIFKVFEDQTEGADPMIFEPTKNYTNDTFAYHFKNKYLFQVKDRVHADLIDIEILDYLKKRENHIQYLIYKEVTQKHEEKKKELFISLKQISEKIDLGHDINGLCDTCIVLIPIPIQRNIKHLISRIRARV